MTASKKFAEKADKIQQDGLEMEKSAFCVFANSLSIGGLHQAPWCQMNCFVSLRSV